MNTELFNALRNGIAVFAFMKNDGTLRTAIGTLDAREIAKVSPYTKVKDITVADGTNRYFDLQCGGWRRICYRGGQETLIGTIENGKLIPCEVA